MQKPSGFKRTYYVVASLHDGGGNVANFVYVVQKLRVGLKEPTIDEEMAEVTLGRKSDCGWNNSFMY